MSIASRSSASSTQTGTSAHQKPESIVQRNTPSGFQPRCKMCAWRYTISPGSNSIVTCPRHVTVRVIGTHFYLFLIPVPDLKATNSFSRISDSGDLLRISSRLIQIWYQSLSGRGCRGRLAEIGRRAKAGPGMNTVAADRAQVLLPRIDYPHHNSRGAKSCDRNAHRPKPADSTSYSESVLRESLRRLG